MAGSLAPADDLDDAILLRPAQRREGASDSEEDLERSAQEARPPPSRAAARQKPTSGQRRHDARDEVSAAATASRGRPSGGGTAAAAAASPAAAPTAAGGSAASPSSSRSGAEEVGGVEDEAGTDEEGGPAAPEPERRPLQPYDVPTTGRFWLHDDRGQAPQDPRPRCVAPHGCCASRGAQAGATHRGRPPSAPPSPPRDARCAALVRRDGRPAASLTRWKHDLFEEMLRREELGVGEVGWQVWGSGRHPDTTIRQQPNGIAPAAILNGTACRPPCRLAPAATAGRRRPQAVGGWQPARQGCRPHVQGWAWRQCWPWQHRSQQRCGLHPQRGL
jgi:hypothetical protein